MVQKRIQKSLKICTSNLTQKMTQKGSQNGPKMAPKSLQIGPKIGSQTICLHANASSPSVRAQKPLRKPIWDRFGAHLASIWARLCPKTDQKSIEKFMANHIL